MKNWIKKHQKLAGVIGVIALVGGVCAAFYFTRKGDVNLEEVAEAATEE